MDVLLLFFGQKYSLLALIAPLQITRLHFSYHKIQTGILSVKIV